MTISAAFNNALSGLTAAGRASALVSDNISNALTPGYGRRTLEVASNQISGGGVRVVDVVRHSDPALTASRRVADAGHAHASGIASFHKAMEMLVGGLDDPASIANQLSAFESSLIAAASNPGSATRLDTAVVEAVDLANAIAHASDGVRAQRSGADRSIGRQVEQLNGLLSDIEALNSRIQNVRLTNGNTAALLDQRQLLIDDVNSIVPVNVMTREHGKVALVSNGGAILLDGQAAELSFSTTGETVPQMSVENGLLSGLEINGMAVRTSGPASAIQGGTLAGAFEIRDELSVEMQQDFDAVARDLIERFEASGVDPTVTGTDPGLFTDDGARFSESNLVGLAGRLQVNEAVVPEQGGQSWRLRDGLGAASPGSVGDARQLQSFQDALADPRTPPSERLGTGALSAAGVSAAFMSRVGQNSSTANEDLSFAAVNKTEMERLELEQGVDTDTELQSLMLVEQAYAANARVVQTVDEMMDALLRL